MVPKVPSSRDAVTALSKQVVRRPTGLRVSSAGPRVPPARPRPGARDRVLLVGGPVRDRRRYRAACAWEGSRIESQVWTALTRSADCTGLRAAQVSAFHKGQSVLHVARRLLRAVSRASRNLCGSPSQPELVICGFLRPPRRFSDHDRRPRGTVSCVDRADRVRPG